MAKRPKARGSSEPIGDVPVVGLREPCPCGSGRRYKACHGRGAGEVLQAPKRPFAGFASECDLVALRELVPAATTAMNLQSGGEITVATVLPMAWPALVRKDGRIMLGLQVTTGSGDASADLGAALDRALHTEPGEPVTPFRVEAGGPRLQDLVRAEQPLTITVHEGFDFWIDGQDSDDELKASLERASSYAHPTARLKSVTAAYWTQMGAKEHLRWVMPHDEEALVTALARLHAAKADVLVPDSKLVGMFRAQGLVAPVWDLPLGTGAAAIEEPAAAFGKKLDQALKETKPLDDAERRARASLTTRQVTLR
jgi:hypothetical protein